MKSKSFPRRRLLVVFSVLVGMAFLGAQTKADTVMLTSVKETTILSSPTNFGNGAGPSIFSGKTNSRGLRRGLVAFDLSAIPVGSMITDASLSMFLEKGKGGNVNISLHRIETDWGEGDSSGRGGGAPAMAGDATWIDNFFNVSSWNNPGGDFVSLSSATSLAGNNETSNPVIAIQWNSSGVIQDAQAWVDGSASNFGWMVLGNETTNRTAKSFSAVTNPPTLTVTFTPPPPPTHREQWVSQHFPSDPENAADALDLDGDGLLNLLEYAFDFNPRGFNAGALPDPVVRSLTVSGSTADFLTLQFIRIPAAADLTYTVESSGDLANWTILYMSVKGADPVNSDHVVSETGTATRTVTVRDTLSVSAAPKRFLRLRIVRETPQGK